MVLGLSVTFCNGGSCEFLPSELMDLGTCMGLEGDGTRGAEGHQLL
jgi:hypothetical protein